MTLAVEGGPTQTFKPHLEYHAVSDQEQDGTDTLLMHRYPTSENFTLDGVPYALVLAGVPAGQGKPLADAVHVPEGRTVSVELKAILVRTDRLDVVIRDVRFKGQVAGSQADEYIEVVNRSAVMAPVDGSVVNAGQIGQDFTFPIGSGTAALAPGIPTRIYTNEIHPEWGGHSFATKSGIWNDKGDTGEVRNAQGTVLARYSYGTHAN
ncbi:lamin tail domain-containing protein [Streptomyces parvus]|uniref:lamin tail domain-containing protein n=1 Tax=Streptomyces parvus TaxID=66428 RepID=UPI0037146FD4